VARINDLLARSKKKNRSAR